jgi:hypothetical protein
MKSRKTTLIAGIIGAALVVSSGVASACAGEPVARTTTLCELGALVDLPGSAVSFQAVASTDLHHGVTLSDPACPNSGLRFGAQSDSADQSVAIFLSALTTQAPYLAWRSLSGIFTGTVSVTPSGERRFVPIGVQDFQEVADEP